MRDALRAELYKTVHRRMTYILLAALIGLVALFYVILWLRIRQGPDHRGAQAFVRYLALKEGMSFRNVVPYGLQLERFFVTLVCVIFTATMMGNEYDWRTAGVVISRGVPRPQFIAAKLIVSVGFALIAVVVAFAVAMALSAWFSNLYQLPYGSFGLSRFADAGAGLARTSYVVLPFVLMALVFATIWRSAGQAVGFSLGFFFLEGIFTGLLDSARGLLSRIPEGLFNANVQAVMSGNGTLSGDSQDRGPFSPSPGGIPEWRGAAFLLAWIAAFALFAFWRFQRRDIQE
jgi:ABC-type transport system involved in multi-copper enzyme maturation permease subunit